MRILICGDRHWTDLKPIEDELEATLRLRGTIEYVIHGAAPGADTLAGIAAKHFDIRVLEYPAQWGRYGRGAGPIRNQQMLDEGEPDLVWAFHDDLSHSTGTKDMVTRAKKQGFKVLHFWHYDPVRDPNLIGMEEVK